MSFINQLSVDQVSLIVALPYRAGLFVSQSDQDGGDESDADEAQVLSDLINGYAAEVFGSETVQYVLSETINRQEQWGAWGHDLEDIEGECEQAVDILEEYVDPKEVSAFKKHIMEIGESVALAFREVEDLSFMQQISLRMAHGKARKKAAKRGQAYMSFDQYLNISRVERKALERLALALGTVYF